MARDINLLTQKEKGFFSEERLLLLARSGAVISVVLVLSLSILFFLLSRDPSVVAVKADESKTLAQLTLIQNKTAKYLVIVDRVNKIKTLEKTKSNFDSNITTFIGQVPAGVSITNFVLDQHSLSLSLSSSNLSLLGNTIDSFSSLVTSKKSLKDLTIQGLVSDEKSGKYVLTLTANLL